MNLLARLWNRLVGEGPMCPHVWRAARDFGGMKPPRWGRYCHLCETFEVLSPEDLYAYFGIYPK